MKQIATTLLLRGQVTDDALHRVRNVTSTLAQIVRCCRTSDNSTQNHRTNLVFYPKSHHLMFDMVLAFHMLFGPNQLVHHQNPKHHCSGTIFLFGHSQFCAASPAPHIAEFTLWHMPVDAPALGTPYNISACLGTELFSPDVQGYEYHSLIPTTFCNSHAPVVATLKRHLFGMLRRCRLRAHLPFIF